MNPGLAERIDQLLPQTQCGLCGYAGCKPYAEAVAGETADIDRCPPGGDAGVQALAMLLGHAAKPVNPANGIAKVVATVAVIDEAVCIGCTKCIQACPVDAILGAAQLMHTVIRDECSGCELCIPPCPVDCIRMEPARGPLAALPPLARAGGYRARYTARNARLERERRAQDALRADGGAAGVDPVAAALARVQARKAAAPPDA